MTPTLPWSPSAVGTRTGWVCALQLVTVPVLGTFLANPTDVPPGVVAHLGRQLVVADPTRLVRYLDRPATHREHAGEIQRRYGYRDFADQPEHFRLVRWLDALRPRPTRRGPACSSTWPPPGWSNIRCCCRV